jgi:hypothetical protein
MTSEPDSKPGRRPPTIELTATEVGQSAAAAGADAAAEGAAPPHGEAAGDSAAHLWRSHAVSVFAGAIAMAVVIAGLWYAGFVPTREAAAPPPATPAPNAALGEDITARLDKIEGTLKASRPEPAPGDRLAATEAQSKSLSDSVSALRRRIDEIAAAAQAAQKGADAASAAADTAKNATRNAVERGDLETLTKRIAALEAAVNTLIEQVAQRTSGADDRTVRLTIVAEALRETVERGAPFQDELAAVKSLGAREALTAPLEPFVAAGVPSAAALAHELASLTPALLQASDTTPNDATFLAKLEAHAQKLVRITPVDAPVGNDPSAVVARIDGDAGRTDIAAALRDIAALPDPAKTLAAAWVKKAEARNAAIAASRQIAAEALAALGKTASQ